MMVEKRQVRSIEGVKEWLKDFQKFTHQIELCEKHGVWGKDRRNSLGKGTEIKLLQPHSQREESRRS